MVFRQLFDPESWTYTYLLGDGGQAVLIDPVREMVERDLEQLAALSLTLVCTLETHVHADHVTGAWALKQKTGSKIAVAEAAGVACADVELVDGDVVRYGQESLTVRATPGHTRSCLTYVGDGVAFTGDALLVRGCGRTDFQEGDARALYHSVRDVILALPPHTLLYPAHDYHGRGVTSVVEERTRNPRLKDGIGEEAFAAIMAGLTLAPPRKIKEAVPANLRCGDVPSSPMAPGAVEPPGFIGGEGI